MRKTTEYFGRKLMLCQKMNNIAWIGMNLKMEQTVAKVDYGRHFHRYRSKEEILNMFEKGSIMLGFKLKENKKKITFVYGNKRAQDVHCLTFISERESTVECGFRYTKMRLKSEGDGKLCDVKTLRMIVTTFCVLVPYVKENRGFGK